MTTVNEGVLVNNSKILMKSEMIKVLKQLGQTTPERWQESVFEQLTGEKVGEIDWKVEDNHAGYYTFTKSFDGLIGELVEDGFVRTEERDGQRMLAPRDTDGSIDYSQLVQGR